MEPLPGRATWIPKGGHIKPVNDEKGSGMTLSHWGLFKKGAGVSKQWHVSRVK
jgi:hypothetical protein